MTGNRLVRALSMLAALGLVPLLGAGFASAAAAHPYSAYTGGRGDVTVSRDGDDVLKLNLVAWGPSWAWAGIGGETQSQNGAAAGTLNVALGKSSKPLRIGFQADQPAANRLRLRYELQVDADTDLTMVIVEAALGRLFEGKNVVVESAGPAKTVSYPLGRGELGNQVRALRVSDPQTGTMVIRFDPPCEVAAEGAARIVLAKDHLQSGTAPS